MKYTEDEVLELKKCMEDPKHFIKNYYKIQHPSKGLIPFDLKNHQERFIDQIETNRFMIGKFSRQTGKTATIAAYALWYAMFKSNQTIMIAGFKVSHAREILQRIRLAYDFLPEFIRSGTRYNNKSSVEFDNGSRIFVSAANECAGRGMAIDLLICDEFAYVTQAKDFWRSVSPSLYNNGNCIIASTENKEKETVFDEIFNDALDMNLLNRRSTDSNISKNGFMRYEYHGAL